MIRSQATILFAALAVVFVLSGAYDARAADACLQAATKAFNDMKKSPQLTGLRHGAYADGANPGKWTALAGASPCGASGECRRAYFTAASTVPDLDGNPELAGFVRDQTAGYDDWHSANAAGCPNLKSIVYVRGQAPAAGASESPPAVGAVGPKLQAAVEGLRQNNRPTDASWPALDAYKQLREAVAANGGVATVPPGIATGAPEVVAEGVQILGQIVADRASAEAYDLLKRKLEELLHCSAPVVFRATCQVLVPLRLQDVAMSRDALFGALAADAFAYINGKGSGRPNPLLVAAVRSQILPHLLRPKLSIDGAQSRAVLETIQTYTAGLQNSLTPAQRAVAAGTIAFATCAASKTTEDTVKRVLACDVGAVLDHVLAPDDVARPAALSLAVQLIAIVSNKDPRDRFAHATDTLFATACMLAAPDGDATQTNSGGPVLACADASTVTALDLVGSLTLEKAVVDAALDGDSNALIASIVHALAVVNDALVQKESRRAFLILGALTQYAATFTAPGDGSAPPTAEQLHEQRTKILESLTTDMTQRTGRNGDFIASLGGSLRGVGGARFGAGTRAFYGPLSLPLGVGFDYLNKDDGGPGFHGDVTVVDLGQYLSFDKSASVRTPDVEDALTLGGTVSISWGKSLPFILGLTAGYSPHFPVDPAKPDSKGSFNIGATAGIYVPLFDMN